MSTFASLILERGAATYDSLETAVDNQVLRGGDLGTNLVEVGALKENALQRLLSEFYEMPVGPQGQLPELTEDLEKLVSRKLAGRFRVYPVKRTRRTLHIATSEPLEPETEKELRGVVGLQLRPVLVTPLRLSEVLARECELVMRERDASLLQHLNNGGTLPREPRGRVASAGEHVFPVVATYRRMSERPDGIVPSTRQPKRSPVTAPTVPSPDTLDGVGAEEALSRTAKTVDPAAHVDTTPPGGPYESEPSDGSGRITQPYAEPGDDDQKRDTQPWRDGGDEEAPLSVAGEFSASLSDTPPSAEAKIHEEHRRFRHRGPFTRAQAELAVSQAPDVHTVLEILVRYARQFFERSVLMVVAGNQAELRLAHGLTMALAMLSVSLEEPSVMQEAFASGDPVIRALGREGVDSLLRQKLTVNGDQPLAVIPLTIRERVVALFYGDDRSDGVDEDAVADVTDFIEICAGEVTRLIIARKTP